MRILARTARLVSDRNSGGTFDLQGPQPEVDLDATLSKAQRVSDYLYRRKQTADHIRSAGVDLVDEAGNVTFVDAHTIAEADGRARTADRKIIAVGGKTVRPPIPRAELGLTYEEAGVVASSGSVCLTEQDRTGPR